MLKIILLLIFLILFKVLVEMGYGDEIIFFDVYFFVYSLGLQVICVDGFSVSDLLWVIILFFELDSYVLLLVMMVVVEGDMFDFSVEVCYCDVLLLEVLCLDIVCIDCYVFYEWV